MRQRIEDGHRQGTCPNCGEALGDSPVGTGRHDDGRFCSQKCQIEFHQDYYRERAKASRPSPN